MTESKESKFRETLIKAKGKVRLDIQRDEHEDKLIEQRLAHLREIAQVKIEAERDAFKHALASFQRSDRGGSTSAIEDAPEALKATAKPAPRPKKR